MNKVVLTLLGVGLALILTAQVGFIPLIPHPGHPGGFYLQVTSTGYGVEFVNITGGDKHVYDVHISPDNLSATVTTFGSVRDTYQINFTLKEKGEENVPVIIDVYADPGVDVDFKGGEIVNETKNVTKKTIKYWVAKIVVEKKAIDITTLLTRLSKYHAKNDTYTNTTIIFLYNTSNNLRENTSIHFNKSYDFNLPDPSKLDAESRIKT